MKDKTKLAISKDTFALEKAVTNLYDSLTENGLYMQSILERQLWEVSASFCLSKHKELREIGETLKKKILKKESIKNL